MRRRALVVTVSGSLALLLALSAASSALAQPPAPFNERQIRRQVNVQDKEDIWVLDLVIKDPRLITVDIPGRGRKLVWYLIYSVVNKTGQPRTFIPDFELVTPDPPAVYQDEVLPKAQEAIRKIEDPTGALNIKNSVTIASEPIPPSKPDAFPRKVWGVAMWTDTGKEQKLQDATRFSIFVAGLSNGWSLDDGGVVRRKTLQLNFRRLGDRYSQDARDIRWVPPAEWLYRAYTSSVPGRETKPKNAAPKPAPASPQRQPGRVQVIDPLPPLPTASAR